MRKSYVKKLELSIHVPILSFTFIIYPELELIILVKSINSLVTVVIITNALPCYRGNDIYLLNFLFN